jgi:hypothetical protein
MHTPTSPLAGIRRYRHNRVVALFALLALLFAGTAYVVHGLDHTTPLSQHAFAHCDLCLHFSGTAGAPENLASPGTPPAPLVGSAAPETPQFTAHAHPTNRFPRGPPALT